jgi:signal transduction histidine kinase
MPTRPSRLAALRRTQLLDSAPERDFDLFTRLAAHLLKSPVALVSLVDAEREFFKSAVGLGEPWSSRREAPLSHSFCHFGTQARSALVVSDAREHPLLRESPGIAELKAIAYAGVPLFFDDEAIGMLCVVDHEPRAWADADVALLHDLAHSVVAAIELRVLLREAREQGSLLEAVLESVGDGVLAVDRERGYIVVNAAARKLFDTATVQPGLPIRTDWGPMHAAAYPDGTPLQSQDGVLSRGLRGEATDHLTFTLQRPGAHRPSWVEATGRPLRDEHGKPFASVGVYRDVSQREAQATALLAAQELLDQTGRLADVGGWRLDLATLRSEWTAQVHRLFEVSPEVRPDLEATIGRYAAEARPVIRAALEKCIRTGEGWDLELPFVTAKGRKFWGRTRGEVQRKNGVVTHLVGALQDITPRRLAQYALRRERSFLESVLDRLPNTVVFVFGENGTVERAHGALALAPADIVGAPIASLGTDAEQPRLEAAVRECFLGRDTTLDVKREGRRIELHFAPLATEESGERRGIAMGYDVTERDALRVRLASQERLVTIGTLAGGVGHEINNPLAYVSANLELVDEELRALANEAPSSRFEEVFEMVTEARGGADRIRKIVRGLLSFSREADALLPTNVVDALEMSIRMAMHELRARATVVRDFKPVPLVLADDTRLGQVFINLLTNAGQAFGDRPLERNHVFVSTWTNEDGNAVVQIADDGMGMTPEVAARMFEPFFTTKGVGRGTGLGLSICHNVVTALGGDLVCETAPGQGAVFRVTLKASDRPSAPAVSMTTRGNTETRGRVLVIDDEVGITSAVTRMLSGQHDVTVQNDARAARERLLEGAHFDVILCDIAMPGLPGPKLYEELRMKRPELLDRIVFISGSSPHAEAKRFLESVPNVHVEKPFSIPELRAVVLRYVARD